MVLGAKLKALRANKSLTQKQLGEKLGVSAVTIRCWENESKSPSLSAIIGLSSAFGVSADYLLGTSGATHITDVSLSAKERELVMNFRSLDSYGRKAVISVCKVEMERVSSSSKKPIGFEHYIPHFLTPSAAGVAFQTDDVVNDLIRVNNQVYVHASFAVDISGNSMEPIIHDGETVFVQRCDKLSEGEVGIFCVDGAMYCKQYYTDAIGNVTLVSANPELRQTNIEIPYDSDISVKCYGRVMIYPTPSLPAYFTEDGKGAQ